MRHHYDFGADRPVVGDDLVRAEAWDALRTRTSGAFAVAASREDLERSADDGLRSVIARAQSKAG